MIKKDDKKVKKKGDKKNSKPWTRDSKQIQMTKTQKCKQKERLKQEATELTKIFGSIVEKSK